VWLNNHRPAQQHQLNPSNAVTPQNSSPIWECSKSELQRYRDLGKWHQNEVGAAIERRNGVSPNGDGSFLYADAHMGLVGGGRLVGVRDNNAFVHFSLQLHNKRRLYFDGHGVRTRMILLRALRLRYHDPKIIVFADSIAAMSAAAEYCLPVLNVSIPIRKECQHVHHRYY